MGGQCSGHAWHGQTQGKSSGRFSLCPHPCAQNFKAGPQLSAAPLAHSGRRQLATPAFPKSACPPSTASMHFLFPMQPAHPIPIVCAIHNKGDLSTPSRDCILLTWPPPGSVACSSLAVDARWLMLIEIPSSCTVLGPPYPADNSLYDKRSKPASPSGKNVPKNNGNAFPAGSNWLHLQAIFMARPTGT